MDGWPVWLASVTLRDLAGRIRPTETWSDADLRRGEALLETALDGLGDQDRQREFRMCSTLCRHRAVSEAEARKLPDAWFETDALDVAGAPVELLWERGIPPSLSSQPCANPRWMPLSQTDARLKFPIDCGVCPTCEARKACSRKPMRRPIPTV